MTPSLARQQMAMTLLYGLALVPLAEPLGPPVSLYVYGLLALNLAGQRWPFLRPNAWIRAPLLLVAFVLVLGTHHRLVGQEGGTALLACMLALKLLEGRSLRDVRVSGILLCFLLVAAVLFDQSPKTALFLLGVLLGDLALLAWPDRRDFREALKLVLVLGLQALPLTLVLFAFFPRLETPLWNFLPQEQRGRTGIKPWLEMDAVRELVLDGSLAFRVRFEGKVPPLDRLYWRGPVLWETDGRRWLPRKPTRISLVHTRALAESGAEIRYQVTLEPTGRRSLFGLDLPLSVGARDASLTQDFQILTEHPITETRTDVFTSVLDARIQELSLSEVQAALQRPPDTMITPRMRALVDGWREVTQTPDAFVQKGLAFFHREPFYYTLSPPPLGANPVDEFLFVTRRGFCEHYASSFALLMRLGGVPARIVLGYLGGAINPLGGHLVVRQSDAHAWVEVWLNERGWVRVDPTAAIDPARIERMDTLGQGFFTDPLRFRDPRAEVAPDLLQRVRWAVDALDEGWNRWVLGLARRDQLRWLDRLGLGAFQIYGLIGLMLLGGMLMAGFVVLGLAYRGRKKPERDALLRLYRRFQSHLARRGIAPDPKEGPLDYGRRVARIDPELGRSVAIFTALYGRLRYGTLPATPDQMRRLRALFQEIRRHR